jgi:hypothetical protein
MSIVKRKILHYYWNAWVLLTLSLLYYIHSFACVAENKEVKQFESRSIWIGGWHRREAQKVTCIFIPLIIGYQNLISKEPCFGVFMHSPYA